MGYGKKNGFKNYQELFPNKFKRLNKGFDKNIDLVKIFDRFLFYVIINRIDVVDVIIYGNP